MTDTADAMPDTADGSAKTALMHSFWLVFILGVASVLFGVAVLAWPDATTRVLAVLLGIWLMVIGAARTIAAFTSHRGLGRQVLSGIVGVILLIGGVACLRDIAKGLAVLAFMVALTWLFSGIAGVLMAQESTGSTRLWMTALGLVSIVVGLVFMLMPDLSLTVLAITTGLAGLVIGVSELVFAFQLRRFAIESADSSISEGSEGGAVSGGVAPPTADRPWPRYP